MKIVLCLVLLAATALAKPANWFDFDNDNFMSDVNVAPVSYGNCNDQEYCTRTNKTVADCATNSNVRLKLCPKMCGECLPFEAECPKSFDYGCCWNGNEAQTLSKVDCDECVDMPGLESFCSMQSTKHDCDFKANSPEIRKICPVTCDACSDYGN